MLTHLCNLCINIHCHHPVGRKSVLYRIIYNFNEKGYLFYKANHSSTCFITVVRKGIQVEEVNVGLLF